MENVDGMHHPLLGTRTARGAESRPEADKLLIIELQPKTII